MKKKTSIMLSEKDKRLLELISKKKRCQKPDRGNRVLDPETSRGAKNQRAVRLFFYFANKRANEIYRKSTLCPNSFEEKVYCDFKKLEQGLSVYYRDKGIELPSYNKPVNKPSLPYLNE